MKSLSYVFVFILLISLASAYQQNTSIDLVQTCNNCTYCNATKVLQLTPTSQLLLTNLEMTKDLNTYNYTLNTTYTENIGNYRWCYDCGNEDENAVGCIDYEITYSGINPTTAQSGLSIGIIVSIIAIMFFFGFLAFKFMDYENLSFLSLFFLVLSILIAVYGLYLGFVYSRDYLYASTSSPQESLFIGILISLVGITIIAMTFFTIKMIVGLKVQKQNERRGEGWNSSSQRYE